jgi:hypothetical protein
MNIHVNVSNLNLFLPLYVMRESNEGKTGSIAVETIRLAASTFVTVLLEVVIILIGCTMYSIFYI